MLSCELDCNSNSLPVQEQCTVRRVVDGLLVAQMVRNKCRQIAHGIKRRTSDKITRKEAIMLYHLLAIRACPLALPSMSICTAMQSGVVVQNVLFQVERVWMRKDGPMGEKDNGGRDTINPQKKKNGSTGAKEWESASSLPACSKADDGRSILTPDLGSTEPCQACGLHFAPEDNTWDSCRYF